MRRECASGESPRHSDRNGEGLSPAGTLEKDAAGREPIPRRLWGAAAAVAREHGINATSKALHLEFKKLKEYVESGKPTKRTAPPMPQFVELMTRLGGQSA